MAFLRSIGFVEFNLKMLFAYLQEAKCEKAQTEEDS